MAKTSSEANIEQDPITNITELVDRALGYDYEQVRRDAAELAERTGDLLKRLGTIEGSDADPRWGSLRLALDGLVGVDFDPLNGGRLAHQDTASPE